MDVDFIKVSEIVEDFESLIDFAAYCGFGRNFLVSEPEEFALRRLAPLRLKAKIELFAPGAMSFTIAVPDAVPSLFHSSPPWMPSVAVK